MRASGDLVSGMIGKSSICSEPGVMVGQPLFGAVFAEGELAGQQWPVPEALAVVLPPEGPLYARPQRLAGLGNKMKDPKEMISLSSPLGPPDT